MGDRLAGKTIVITGASRGIGAAAAEAMAAEGASLLLLARSSQGLTALAEKLRAGGARVEAMTCDVARYSQVEAAIGHAADWLGGLDALINNAGMIDPIAPLATGDPGEWSHHIDVNLKGIYHGMRAALPAMRARGRGVIVNLSSGAARNPLEGWSAYCAGKAGVAMLTRCAHLEMKGHGIRVFGLSPGTVATDMQRRIKASGINPVSQMDFASHAAPEDPAKALVWLCTDAAAAFAGEEISLRDPEMRARIGLEGAAPPRR
ncbi:SDR family oxidoreductase [Amaricoccus solimangrovi]|uniref:SDR family oxidoreductase n=1 Tax=Amaricoccus solimangrovi TaxID=2589815 RepID=A0A501WXC4_9RHOB|nr:SDR family oxidoreductase [Amaricoccus solimangrovi]TPE52087.1 SDR family oxidoreductase [Amaricoccus solimangrovi]